MKIKNIVTLAAVMAVALVTSTSQGAAPALNTPGTATWTSVTSGQTVQVDYEVLWTGGLYTYEYQIRPTVGNNPGPVESLEIDLNTALDNAVLAVIAPGTDLIAGTGTLQGPAVGNVNALNINFNLAPIMGGFESITVGYTSPLAPQWGTGSALDSNNGPWSAQYAGSGLIPVPVPEPTTMIAGLMLLLPFGASTLRMLRKNRAA